MSNRVASEAFAEWFGGRMTMQVKNEWNGDSHNRSFFLMQQKDYLQKNKNSFYKKQYPDVCKKKYPNEKTLPS